MCSNFDPVCGLETITNTKQAKFTSDILEEPTECNQSNDKNDRVEEIHNYEHVFSIPMLFKIILKNLERPDILNTSLVNKRWNLFSREILLEKKSCLAIINEKNACHGLKRLNSLLVNSETVPFYGLWITEACDRNHHCPKPVRVSEFLSNILRKIDIKHLSLHFRHNIHCITMKCMQEIITKSAGSLEGLSIELTPRCNDPKLGFCKYIELDLQGQWLPNLRFLEFSLLLYGDDLPTNIIKSLVEAAPKLQEIRGSVNEQCLEFILPLKLVSAVKDFDLRTRINTLENCLAFSLENPTLNKFRFSTAFSAYHEVEFCRWKESDQNDIAKTVKQILESSKNSLTKIAVDQYDLILMMANWNIPILQNVTHLSLNYCVTVDIEEGYNMFGNIEWAKYFPNLKEVAVTALEFQYFDRDFYLRNSSLETNAHFVCETVRTFHLAKSVDFEDAGRFQMFQKIFPNVTEIYLEDLHRVVCNLKDLWATWKNIEAIHMKIHILSGTANATPSCRTFDSVFLGISDVEADYLLKSLEELESLEIVPADPNIFNLSKLKKIEIRVFHNESYCSGKQPHSPDSYFLTRLVGQCGFSRLPGLSVEIHRNLCKAKDDCYMALNHLAPCVKFVECEDNY